MPRVRCYAGTAYPERPLAFEWRCTWLDVIEVLWQARTPEGLTYGVLTEDDRRFRLVWRQDGDEWVISEMEARSDG